LGRIQKLIGDRFYSVLVMFNNNEGDGFTIQHTLQKNGLRLKIKKDNLERGKLQRRKRKQEEK